MENCGFVEWVDAEWPENLKNSLTQLWTMYEDSENRHIETENKHAAMVYKLVEEKDKAERKYAMMNADVNKWIDGTVKRVMEENYHKIMKVGREEDQLAICQAEKEKALKALEEVKKQRSHLLVELQALKDLKSCAQRGGDGRNRGPAVTRQWQDSKLIRNHTNRNVQWSMDTWNLG